MNTQSKVVLVAGAASVVGDVIDCTGYPYLYAFARVTVSAATLQGDITFGATIDGQGDLSQAAIAPAMVSPNQVSALTVAPTGLSLDASLAKITIANPAVGTSLFLIRIGAAGGPPQYVVPRFTYTSGGGTVQVVLYAYGYSIAT